jgi:nuclear transport factor 2 (NTF2) superfamily protein
MDEKSGKCALGFDEIGLMHIPDMSANDYAIKESKRRYK